MLPCFPEIFDSRPCPGLSYGNPLGVEEVRAKDEAVEALILSGVGSCSSRLAEARRSFISLQRDGCYLRPHPSPLPEGEGTRGGPFLGLQ